jgi:hypothetical protein
MLYFDVQEIRQRCNISTNLIIQEGFSKICLINGTEKFVLRKKLNFFCIVTITVIGGGGGGDGGDGGGSTISSSSKPLI